MKTTMQTYVSVKQSAALSMQVHNHLHAACVRAWLCGYPGSSWAYTLSVPPFPFPFPLHPSLPLTTTIPLCKHPPSPVCLCPWCAVFVCTGVICPLSRGWGVFGNLFFSLFFWGGGFSSALNVTAVWLQPVITDFSLNFASSRKPILQILQTHPDPSQPELLVNASALPSSSLELLSKIKN